MRKMHCKYKDNEREAEDKKLTTILLAVAMTLPLVACGGGNAGNTNGGNTNSGSTDKHTHVEKVMPAVEPTCTKTGLTEGKRCSECGEVLVAQETVPALGRTTESGTCERCGQSFGDWRIDYYVDDFNQPTDEWYITEDEYLVGTFSNSATTNSKLYANVMVDLDDNVMIFLYEYGSRQVKNSSERYWDEYNITMRTPDGADHKITGTMYCGDDRVNVDDAYIDEVLTALKGEGNVMFRIENADRTVESYLIEVATSNFAELYNVEERMQQPPLEKKLSGCYNWVCTKHFPAISGTFRHRLSIREGCTMKEPSLWTLFSDTGDPLAYLLYRAGSAGR